LDRSDDTGRWLFIGLCIGALIVMVAWGFEIIPTMDPACDEACQGSRDLSAQQSMASAAWAMILVTFVSAALGAWSLHLIRENLVETRKLVRDAERSARAAEEAINTTREMGIAQAKAYIAVTAVSFSKDDGNWLVRVALANSGQTPARTVKVSVFLKVLTRVGEDFEREVLNSIGHEYLTTLPASAVIEAEVQVSDQGDEAADVLYNRGGAVRIYGAVAFDTVFGRREEEEFSFVTVLAGGSILMPERSMRRMPVRSSDRFT
jgi:hypothetical protein